MNFSAADLYIEKYFHSRTPPKIIRLYYKYRNQNTVPKNCLSYSKSSGTCFNEPEKADVESNQIIISTLSTAMMLLTCGARGMFSHIFIDEAGQALETQTLVPLALANPNTCVVLAGDYKQMSPVVYSDFAMKKNFHHSLLQRLLNYYIGHSFTESRIFLKSNFRSHVHLVKFVADIFYGGSEILDPCSKDAVCWDIPALMFYESKGGETQLGSSTGFCNIDEAVLVAEEVENLLNKWPKEWNEMNPKEIGVVSFYMDQVTFFTFLFSSGNLKFKILLKCVVLILKVRIIRQELRARKLYDVYVRPVSDVQG